MEQLEKYDTIHDNIFKMFQDDNFNGVLQLAENCNMEDRGEIRTILMAIKPFKTSPILTDVYKKLSEKLREGSINGII